MRIRPPVDQTFDLGDEYPDDTFNPRGYLNEKGMPKLCRLEFNLTNLQELKQCAYHISELNGRLNKLAYDDERPDLARVFHARAALAECQHLLKHLAARQYRMNKKKPRDIVLGGRLTKDERRARDARYRAVAVTDLGKLNGRRLADIARDKENQAIDPKGEPNE